MCQHNETDDETLGIGLYNDGNLHPGGSKLCSREFMCGYLILYTCQKVFIS